MAFTRANKQLKAPARAAGSTTSWCAPWLGRGPVFQWWVTTHSCPSTVDFLPHANMDTVHHMLLFGCRKPSSASAYW